MVSNHLLLEEPIRMASILEPSKAVSSYFFSFLSFPDLFSDFILDLHFSYVLYGFHGQSFFPAMTKIVGTLGPRSRSPEVISGCLKTGMSGKVSIFIVYYCYFILIVLVLSEEF